MGYYTAKGKIYKTDNDDDLFYAIYFDGTRGRWVVEKQFKTEWGTINGDWNEIAEVGSEAKAIAFIRAESGRRKVWPR